LPLTPLDYFARQNVRIHHKHFDNPYYGNFHKQMPEKIPYFALAEQLDS